MGLQIDFLKFDFDRIQKNLQLSLTMANYIPASTINGNNLRSPTPPKEITSPKGEKYTRTYLTYDYGSFTSEALFELKICKAKVKINSKKAYKLNLTVTDPGDLAGLAQLGLGFAYCVDVYKNKYGLRNFSPTNIGDLRGAFFYPVNDDGELIAGASPIVSLKMNEKTKFKSLKPVINPETKEPVYEEFDTVDEHGQLVKSRVPAFDEEVVDYKTLVDKQFDCSVVFNARDLYRAAGTPLPQMFVRSCMILSNPTESGEVEHSKSEMVRNYLQQNPELLNTLAEQMSKAKIESSSSLLQPKTESPAPQTNLQQSSAGSPAPIISAPNNMPPISQSSGPLAQLNNSFVGLPNIQNTNMAFQLPQQQQQGSMDLNAFLNTQQQQTPVVLNRI